MSNTARKARKRAGIPFVKAAKVGTPLEDRAWFNEVLPGAHGTRYANEFVPRSAAKNSRKGRAMKAYGLDKQMAQPTKRRGLSGLFTRKAAAK